MSNTKQQEAFNILSAEMDKHDTIFIELKKFEEQNGYIPDMLPDGRIIAGNTGLMKAYGEYKQYGGWRNVPGVKRRLWKTAKNMVKNGNKK